MNTWLTYTIIAAILLVAELLYFRIADRCNIIDKPNERSSHSSIVLRGGGIIFTLAMVAWAVMMVLQGKDVTPYLPFLAGLILIAGISFWDDVHSLPDSVRLAVQFAAIILMFWSIGILHWDMWWVIIISLIISAGVINIFNFMDGINGMTAGYALAVLVPLLLLNESAVHRAAGFIDSSYLTVAIIGVLVFCVFNFRPKGKAKCFAGDVGSVGMAFIVLFALGRLIARTGDITYMIFLIVYGADGFLTIIHRILLHEKLGEAHRKHAYQLMANELKIGHVKVALLYAVLQAGISLGFIFLCPESAPAHWIYLAVTSVLVVAAYVLFIKKYYHLHEEYLKSLQ